MTAEISFSAYAIWASVAVGQGVVANAARLKYPGLFVYLVGEVILTAVGLPSSRLLPLPVFMKIFFIAGYCSDALTVLLVLSSFDLIRRRARPHYRSAWLTGGMFCLALLLALPLTGHALAGGWATYANSYVVAHTVWTWLGICLALIPVYSVVSGAYPTRSLVLLLTGTGLYVAANSGAIDFLITRHFAHHRIAGAISDCFYFVTLSAWWSACHLAEPVSVPAIAPFLEHRAT